MPVRLFQANGAGKGGGSCVRVTAMEGCARRGGNRKLEGCAKRGGNRKLEGCARRGGNRKLEGCARRGGNRKLRPLSKLAR